MDLTAAKQLIDAWSGVRRVWNPMLQASFVLTY